jgi:hypothetical protein
MKALVLDAQRIIFDDNFSLPPKVFYDDSNHIYVILSVSIDATINLQTSYFGKNMKNSYLTHFKMLYLG